VNSPIPQRRDRTNDDDYDLSNGRLWEIKANKETFELLALKVVTVA